MCLQLGPFETHETPETCSSGGLMNLGLLWYRAMACQHFVSQTPRNPDSSSLATAMKQAPSGQPSLHAPSHPQGHQTPL